MYVILCTISSASHNDSIVDGFVHFTLDSLIGGNEPTFAIYCTEDKSIELRHGEESIGTLKPIQDPSAITQDSPKSGCIHHLLSYMPRNSRLHAVALSDLGDTVDEVLSIYCEFLQKGISLSFFDTSYLDSDLLEINEGPTAYQHKILNKMIRNYFAQSNSRPVLTNDALQKMAALRSSKKKSGD